MLTKLIFQICLLLGSTGIAYAQSFELIEKEAEKILLSLADNNPVDQPSMTKLSNLVSSAIENDSIEYVPKIHSQAIDSLAIHLSEFESQTKNITPDSSFVLFNDWYLHLQNVFYNYEKQKYLSSGKPKIILFSTSVSCYCTLKMSREQTADFIKVMSGNPDNYDYWIIDSYWNNELQIEYDTFFSPSVIILNDKNSLINKIEYDDKMVPKLSAYIETELKQNENVIK